MAANNYLAVHLTGSSPNIFGITVRMYKKFKQDSTVLTVFKTIIFSLILLSFFGYLFVQADPIFARLLEDVIVELPQRLLLSLVLLFALSVLFTIKQKPLPFKPVELAFVSYIELFVPAVTVALLFIGFLVIQAQYLFGGQAAFATLDITYSDYVRNGFTELLIATFFGGVLTYFITLKQRFITDVFKQRSLRVVNIIILIALFCLLASAFKRDLLYIETYGLTRVRIIGGMFLVWLAGVLVLLTGFGAITKFGEKILLSGIAIVTVLLVVAFNMLNIDAVIAQSVSPQSKTSDYFYNLLLSTDAYSTWQPAIEHSLTTYESLRLNTSFTNEQKNELAEAKLVLAALKHQLVTLQAEEYSACKGDTKLPIESTSDGFVKRFDCDVFAWQNFNYSAYKARVFYRQNQTLFTTMECVLTEIEDLEKMKAIDLQSYVNQRMYDYERPLVWRSTYFPMYPLRRSTETVQVDSCA